MSTIFPRSSPRIIRHRRLLLLLTLEMLLAVLFSSETSAFTCSTAQKRRRHPPTTIDHFVLNSERVPWPGQRPPPQGGDMAYLRENVVRQMDHYQKIRAAGGAECCNDIYVRNPKLNSFWFVGKVARCTGTATLNEAIARQLNLIEEHACRLRPVELGRAFGNCQIWTAPVDTELELSNDNPSIKLERMQRYVDGCEKIDNIEVGLNLEVVTNQGVGFFVERDNTGKVPPPTDT